MASIQIRLIKDKKIIHAKEGTKKLNYIDFRSRVMIPKNGSTPIDIPLQCVLNFSDAVYIFRGECGRNLKKLVRVDQWSNRAVKPWSKK